MISAWHLKTHANDAHVLEVSSQPGTWSACGDFIQVGAVIVRNTPVLSGCAATMIACIQSHSRLKCLSRTVMQELTKSTLWEQRHTLHHYYCADQTPLSTCFGGHKCWSNSATNMGWTVAWFVCVRRAKKDACVRVERSLVRCDKSQLAEIDKEKNIELTRLRPSLTPPVITTLNFH